MIEISRAASSRACFALAAGLEIAEGQSALRAVEQAKIASILFDEIIIEAGFQTLEFSTDALLSGRRHTGADGISTALLEKSRTVVQGTKSGLAIRSTESHLEIYYGTDLPNIPDAYSYVREVSSRYVSEYHSGILDDLAKLNADWVRVVGVEINDQKGIKVKDEPLVPLSLEASEDPPYVLARLDVDQTEQLHAELSAVLETDPGSHPPSPDEGDPLERALVEGLIEAIQIADRLEAVPVLSTAFRDVAQERGVPVGLPGEESLGFVIPNVSTLPWEAIAEFRNHDGAVEARARLREFEAEAAAREPREYTELVRHTGTAVTSGLVEVARDLAPSLAKDLQGPILETGVSFVPVVGQFAALALSMGDVIAALRQHQEFSRSWVAALFDLRDAAVDATLGW